VNWASPIELAGPHALLVPLSHDHVEGLREAVRDGELWHLWFTDVPSPEMMHEEIERRLGLQAQGSMLPWTVLDSTGRIVGMTTYMHIEAVHRRVEIGSTWYAARAQRTLLNTQCKRLLLAHAFDGLDCIAVEFRTHRLNTRSRDAIERLGAQLDGILRSHRIGRDGTLRDTAVYSITAAEWPTVRRNLDHLLEAPR
jgi:RimJ/RimL family protein N-acetyltransferase